MIVGIAPLNYYGQNNYASTHAAGVAIRSKGIELVGLTEVRSSSMATGLINGLGSAYHYRSAGESPQAGLSKKWKLIDFDVVEHTDGEKDVTPTLFFGIGTYQNTKKPSKVVRLISTHFVPLTLGGKPRSQYSLRWSMWSHAWKMLKTLVGRAYKKGITVFVVGDFNHYRASKDIIKQIHYKAKWLVRKGLDWMFVIEGKTKVRRFSWTRALKTGSDHTAWYRYIVLT